MRKCLICNKRTYILKTNLFDDRYGSKGIYKIYRCEKCGFGRTEPALARNEISSLYKQYYPIKNLSPREVKNQVNNKSMLTNYLMGTDNVAHLYISNKSQVLDIGSASGVSLLEIEKQGAHAYGIEPNPISQSLAKALKLNVFKGLITDNPFPRKKFDYITASQVIEHEPDPLGFLLAIKKKMRKDGKVILSFPNLNSLNRYIFGRRWIHWHVPYHVNHFTKKSFFLLAHKAGYRVIKLKTKTPNLWTLLQLRTLFSEGKEGEPSQVWVNNSSDRETAELINRIKLILLQSINKIAPLSILPFNRAVDLLGFGESILVELKIQ